MRISSRLRLIALALVLLGALAATALYATGRHHGPSGPAAATRTAGTAAAGTVCQSRLPGQARDTLVLIGKGGPYPYRTDGVVFDNREKRLPKEPSGYYHEYTVVTPGSGTAAPGGSSPAARARSTGRRTTTPPSSGSTPAAEARYPTRDRVQVIRW